MSLKATATARITKLVSQWGEVDELSLQKLTKAKYEKWGRRRVIYKGEMHGRRNDALIQKWSQSGCNTCPSI